MEHFHKMSDVNILKPSAITAVIVFVYLPQTVPDRLQQEVNKDKSAPEVKIHFLWQINVNNTWNKHCW